MYGFKKVKLEAPSNMICTRKSSRADRTYDPGVIPRIIQQTTYQPCQKMGEILPGLAKGELVRAILRPCPLRKHIIPSSSFCWLICVLSQELKQSQH